MDDKILAIDLNLSRANISAKPKQHRYLCLNHLCILLSILSENSGTHLGQNIVYLVTLFMHSYLSWPLGTEYTCGHSFPLFCNFH